MYRDVSASLWPSRLTATCQDNGHQAAAASPLLFSRRDRTRASGVGVYSDHRNDTAAVTLRLQVSRVVAIVTLIVGRAHAPVAAYAAAAARQVAAQAELWKTPSGTHTTAACAYPDMLPFSSCRSRSGHVTHSARLQSLNSRGPVQLELYIDLGPYGRGT